MASSLLLLENLLLLSVAFDLESRLEDQRVIYNAVIQNSVLMCIVNFQSNTARGRPRSDSADNFCQVLKAFMLVIFLSSPANIYRLFRQSLQYVGS